MARIARIVVPDVPHHVIQRGNRRQKVFFSEEDKQLYLNCLHNYARPRGIKILAYCLMDNHVHLIVTPKDKRSLAKGVGEAHRRYTSQINSREGWKGYLWEGRFKSYPLSETYLYSAVRYVEQNPVRAGLVSKAEDYFWSSARAHVFNLNDRLLEKWDSFLVEDWSAYLALTASQIDCDCFKMASSGRPLGDKNFINRIEQLTGRTVRKKKTGRQKQIIRPDFTLVSSN